MEPYVDYDYYENNFCGDIIPQEQFVKYAKLASSKIDYYTYHRIRKIDDSIKNATCSIAELLFEQNKLKSQLLNQNNSNQVASETLGPRSITYINNSQYQDKHLKSDEALNISIYQICKENINNELLYRGL